MLLALGFGNLAYARHACVMSAASASSQSMAADPHHIQDSENRQQEHRQDHEKGHDCVCAGSHQHCSATPSITISTAITVDSVNVRDVVMTMDSHPFPAHLADLIRPPSLSC